MSDAWKNPWSTDVLPFDRFTADRRWFSPGCLTSRQVPMPLLLQIKTAKGHEGAVVVGAITDMSMDDIRARASGHWLNPAKVPEVDRALALMEGGIAKVSADLEPDMDITVEESSDGGRPYVFYERARICALTIVPIGAFDGAGMEPFGVSEEQSLALTGTTSWRSMPAQPRELPYNADQAFKNILAWADGSDARARSMFLWLDPQAAEGTRDRFRLPIGDVVNGRPALNFHAIYAAAALVSGAHGGLPTVNDEEKGRLRRIISDIYSRLSGLFGDPNLTAPWDDRAKLPDVKASSLDAVTASAAPVAPPDEWFTDPQLPGPTPAPIITPDGRVMVHLATHDSCHRTLQQQTGQCFTPPPSPSGYRRFMDGSVLTASGRTLPVGRITVSTTHPGLSFGAQQAKQHYDNTGSCVAVVAAGEDERGIWLSGALVPEATPQQVAMLRRSPLSGDWRRHGAEGLDLIAALAVNTAGFPAPYRGAVRALSTTTEGDCHTLVASGAPIGDNESVTMPIDTVPPVPPDPIPAPAPAAEPAATAVEQPPAATAPAMDIATIAAAVADNLRDQQQRDERLATLFAIDQFDREQRMETMQPLSQLAPIASAATGRQVDADSTAGRREALKAGKALPPAKPGNQPRYPIRNVEELGKAIRAVGRGSGNHDELRRWIMKRARELKRPDLIPNSWNADGSMK